MEISCFTIQALRLNHSFLLVLLIVNVMPTQQLLLRLNENSLSSLPHENIDATEYRQEENSTPPRSELPDCTLLTTNDSFALQRDLLDLNPAVIYVKLLFIDVEFDSATAYLNEVPSVIDPLTWSWVSEGKGFLFRSFSPNFLHLSLGTLTPDVYHTQLNVSTELCEGFKNATDAAKFSVLSEFIINVYLLAYKENKQEHGEFKVCQEFYHPMSKVKGTFKAWLLNLHVFLYLPGTIEIACWSSTDYTYDIQDNESFPWLSMLYYTIMIIGVFCFPFIIGVMIQHRPPILTGSSMWIDRNTSLPVGLKYVLFFWKGDTLHSGSGIPIFINISRKLLLIGLLFLVSYMEAIVLLTYDESYAVRTSSAYRFAIDYNTYWVLTALLMVFFACYICFAMAIFFTDKTMLLEGKEHRRRLLFQKLPERYQVPAAPTYLPWQNQFFHYMSYRWQMAVDRRIIWDWVWEDTTFGKRVRLQLGRMSLFLQLPISCMLMVALIVLYSPCSYIFIMFITWMDKRDLDSSGLSYSILIYTSVFLLCSPLLFGVIRLVAGIASFIADIGEYTFTGVIVNISVLDPLFFMTMAILSYTVMTVTEFYSKYYKFNVILIKKARRLDDKYLHDPTPTTANALISSDLFWHALSTCQPIRIEVIKSFLKLFTISFLVLIGFQVLEEVNLFNQLSDSAMLVFSLVISFAVPVINNTIKSEAKEEVRKQILKRKIENALETYIRNHLNLDSLTREPNDLEMNLDEDLNNKETHNSLNNIKMSSTSQSVCIDIDMKATLMSESTDNE